MWIALAINGMSLGRDSAALCISIPGENLGAPWRQKLPTIQCMGMYIVSVWILNDYSLTISADDTPPDLPIDLDSHLHNSTYDDGSQSDAPPDLPIESDSQTSASDDGSQSDQEENDSELNLPF